jgi:hypothetical protein
VRDRDLGLASITVRVDVDAAGARSVCLVGTWPPRTLITDEFAQPGDHTVRDGRRLTIALQNASAIYHLDDFNAQTGVWTASLVAVLT